MPHSEPAIDIENIGGNQVKGLWDDNGANESGVERGEPGEQVAKRSLIREINQAFLCLRQAPCLAQELNIESHFNLQTKTTVL